MNEQAFLGSGAAFPFAADPATGRIEVAEGAQNVKQSLFLILKTALGERPFRRSFGTNLNAYAFMDINATTLQMLRRELSIQIYENEPRISGVELTADTSQEGTVLFQISYTSRDTNTQENLVFPYYFGRDEVSDFESPEGSEVYDVDGILEDFAEDEEEDTEVEMRDEA